MGPFEILTELQTFKELVEDWRNTREKRLLKDALEDLLRGDDPTMARHLSHVAGGLSELYSFDRYIEHRLAAEKKGQGRPLPSKLAFPKR